MVMGGPVASDFSEDSVSSSNGSGAMGWLSSRTTTSLCLMLTLVYVGVLNLVLNAHDFFCKCFRF